MKIKHPALSIMLVLSLLIGILISPFAFTTQALAAEATIVFDDMEHGDPFNNGWFSFGGSVGGGGISSNSVDLPPKDGGAFSLETGWGSGGTPGFYGGFGRTFLTNLTGIDHFNFWINPDAGQDFTLEINLQDDDNNNDTIEDPEDDEFQYNCVVSPTGPCAESGGGWQLVSIPLAEFFDDNSFLTGGNGVLDPVPSSAGGNGQLINIVIAVIGNSGSDATFRTDYWAFSDGSLATPIIDNFEDGVAPGSPCVGIPLGFCTFSDGSPVAITTTATPPGPVPGSNAGNNVLQMDANVVAFAGFIHGFENETVDAWIPQNWSTYGGFSFWLYGNNSGTSLFIDLLDNRNPGSTTDDAERWTVAFTDNFTGWQKFEFPFADFTRKEIGNGAPNDGLTLTEVHGWAFGTLNTDGPITYYMDDVALYGFAEVPELAVSFSTSIFEIDEGTTGNIVVRLNRPMNEDDPAQVSVDYATEPSTARPGRDYTPTAGTLTFVNGGLSEQSFPLETFTDGKFLGNKRVVLRLSNLVDVAPGFSTQGSALIIDIDPYDPYLLDDFERGAYLWNSNNVTLNTPEIMTGDPLAVPGQGDYEHILQVDTAVLVDIVISGSICNSGNGAIPVALLTTDSFDALSVNHNSVRFGDALETHRDKKTGEAQRHEDDFEGDGDLDLIFHFRANEIGFDCDSTRFTLTGETFDGQAIVAGGEASFGRDFAIGQDWTRGEALNFWFYGTNSGDAITVQLKDNRAPDPGPTGWNLVWSDEFNDPTGTPPNPANWIYEIGDVTPDGKNGWGNEELQYYTDDPANSSTDGNGNLVITLREADGSLECYYGTCEYTSARLLTQHRKEFAYGRIESRLLVPDGADGLWPAFWSLGSDIVRNPWPGSGEIDFMEYVSRLPDEIFGTIHGPGYSGGASFGGVYDFGEPVYNDYHTFAVEWEPNEIRWYVDDILYHTATPADVAPNEWVFDKPFFMLLNFAIGGNFGGSVSPDLVFPQEYLIDYVRLYQAPDTAERFEASFADNFNGWQQVVIPFASLVRSANQPADAPDDGLTLSEVWGYGFDLAEGGTTSGTMQLDQVRLQLLPPPTEITVTNLNDSGTGSLRQALEDIAIGGTITFDPGLAVGTIHSTGPLVLSQDVTIDSSDAPGINLNGGGTDRLLIVDPGVNAIVNGLTFTNGYGFQLAGCVLNNGALTLDHVTVTGCLMTTDAGDFWQGGGGIYSGDGATLNLIDSTVSNNTSGWTGGGLYSFFNTTTNVIRSTVSGNVAMDVAGGFRTLGEVNIENSTISGNTSTTWHGGAMFITDGVATITNSTITGNAAPGGTTGGLFVGTFTAASATLNLQNTIVANNGDFGCFLAPFGAGAVALNSLGNNLFTDGTCFPVGSDLIVADAGIDSLSDNGGPTLTHALLAGSPAIGAANTSVCPATDQRGVARDAACDIGSYEFP